MKPLLALITIADYMMTEDVLIGGEESGGISFKGHIPEGDGPIMGLLLVEMVAESGKTLQSLVEDLLADVGPAFYERVDLRLSRPVEKKEMTEFLLRHAPKRSATKRWMRSASAMESNTLWRMIHGCSFAHREQNQCYVYMQREGRR
jgi:phosphomannomutase